MGEIPVKAIAAVRVQSEIQSDHGPLEVLFEPRDAVDPAVPITEDYLRIASLRLTGLNSPDMSGALARAAQRVANPNPWEPWEIDPEIAKDLYEQLEQELLAPAVIKNGQIFTIETRRVVPAIKAVLADYQSQGRIPPVLFTPHRPLARLPHQKNRQQPPWKSIPASQWMRAISEGEVKCLGSPESPVTIMPERQYLHSALFKVMIDGQRFYFRCPFNHGGHIDPTVRKTIAASILNEWMKLDTVPQTSVARILCMVDPNHSEGIWEYVGVLSEDAGYSHVGPATFDSSDEAMMADIEAFEFLVGNWDARYELPADNMRMDSKGRIRVLDHDRAFVVGLVETFRGIPFGATLPDRYTRCFIEAIEDNERWVEGLEKIRPHLTAEEEDSLNFRRDIILKDITLRGRPKVPEPDKGRETPASAPTPEVASPPDLQLLPTPVFRTYHHTESFIERELIERFKRAETERERFEILTHLYSLYQRKANIDQPYGALASAYFNNFGLTGDSRNFPITEKDLVQFRRQIEGLALKFGIKGIYKKDQNVPFRGFPSLIYRASQNRTAVMLESYGVLSVRLPENGGLHIGFDNSDRRDACLVFIAPQTGQTLIIKLWNVHAIKLSDQLTEDLQWALHEVFGPISDTRATLKVFYLHNHDNHSEPLIQLLTDLELKNVHPFSLYKRGTYVLDPSVHEPSPSLTSVTYDFSAAPSPQLSELTFADTIIDRDLGKYIEALHEVFKSKDQLIARIKRHLDANRDRPVRVADVAAGLGVALREISRAEPLSGRIQATAVDLFDWHNPALQQRYLRVSERTKRVLRMFGEDFFERDPRPEMMVGDLATFQFREKQDVILAIWGITYCLDPLRAIANLYNQLQVGGELIFSLDEITGKDSSNRLTRPTAINYFLSQLGQSGIRLEGSTSRTLILKRVDEREISVMVPPPMWQVEPEPTILYDEEWIALMHSGKPLFELTNATEQAGESEDTGHEDQISVKPLPLKPPPVKPDIPHLMPATRLERAAMGEVVLPMDYSRADDDEMVLRSYNPGVLSVAGRQSLVASSISRLSPQSSMDDGFRLKEGMTILDTSDNRQATSPTTTNTQDTLPERRSRAARHRSRSHIRAARLRASQIARRSSRLLRTIGG